MRSFANVEHFTPQRKHAVLVPADDGQPGDRKGFGRISLGEDQRTVGGIASSCVVGVVEFRYAWESNGGSRVSGRVMGPRGA